LEEGEGGVVQLPGFQANSQKLETHEQKQFQEDLQKGESHKEVLRMIDCSIIGSSRKKYFLLLVQEM
jgi:hypothetical protein